MFLSILLLAISSSIDALGIGITYGLRKIQLKKWSKLILFCTLVFIILISILTGNILKKIFGETFFKLIGTVILVIMGLIIIFKTDTEDHTFDLDNSHDIDNKEALILGIAISIDGFCVVIAALSFGINMFLFAITVAFLHFAFLCFGNYLGIHLSNSKKIPQRALSKISGIMLILIGILK